MSASFGVHVGATSMCIAVARVYFVHYPFMFNLVFDTRIKYMVECVLVLKYWQIFFATLCQIER